MINDDVSGDLTLKTFLKNNENLESELAFPINVKPKKGKTQGLQMEKITKGLRRIQTFQ